MEAVRAFNNELSMLYESKPPVSRAKMAQITKSAMKAIKFYKHVVQSVEKFIQKCRPEFKVPGLYVIDSIVRQSRHQFGADKDLFAARFCKNITTTFQHLFKCPPEEKSKIVRVLNLWQKNTVLPIEIIQPLQDLAADPTNTQAILSVQRAAEAFISAKSDAPSKKPAPQKEAGKATTEQPQALTDVAKTVTQLLQQNPSTLGGQQQQLQQLQLLQQQLLQHTQTMQDPAVQQQPVIDSTLLAQIQTLTNQLLVKSQSEPPAPSGGVPAQAQQASGFNKKLLDFDYGESDDEEEKGTPQAPPAGGVQTLLNDPNLMQQIHQMSQTIQKTEELRGELSAQEELRQQLLQQQQAEFQQQIEQSEEVEVIESEEAMEKSKERSHRDRRHRSRSRSRDRSRKKHKRSRSRSRSRKRSRERRSRRSRSRDRERERERERERRKKGLPPIKEKHLSVCSSTLWIGHLNRVTSEHDLRGELEKYGPVKSINIIPPRGCAFVGMTKRKDAARALDKLKRGVKLQGNELKVAWATGAGVKDKKFKDWWDVELGVTYIPHSKIEDDLNELSEGGMIDEDTVPEHLKASRVIVIDDDEDVVMDSQQSGAVSSIPDPPAQPPTSQPAYSQPPLPGMVPMMPAGMPPGTVGMMPPFMMGQPVPGMTMGQGAPPGFSHLLRGQAPIMPGAPPPPITPPVSSQPPSVTQTSAPPPQPPPTSAPVIMMPPSTNQNTQLAQAIENIMSNSAAISAVAAQGAMGMMRPGMLPVRAGMLPGMRAQLDMSHPPPPQTRMSLMQQGPPNSSQGATKMMPIKLASDWGAKLRPNSTEMPDVEMKDSFNSASQQPPPPQQQPSLTRPQGGAGILGGPPMQFLGRGMPQMGGPRGPPGDMLRFAGGPRGPMDLLQRLPGNFMGRLPPGFPPQHGPPRPGFGGLPPMPGQPNQRMPGQGIPPRHGMPVQGQPGSNQPPQRGGGNEGFFNRDGNFPGQGGNRPPWGPNRNERDLDEREVHGSHDRDERRNHRGDRDDSRGGRGDRDDSRGGRGDRDDRSDRDRDRDRRGSREFKGDRDERRGDRDDRDDQQERSRRDSGQDRFRHGNSHDQRSRSGGRRSRWGGEQEDGNPNRMPLAFDRTKMAGGGESKPDVSEMLASWSAKHIRPEEETTGGAAVSSIPSLFDVPTPAVNTDTSNEKASTQEEARKGQPIEPQLVQPVSEPPVGEPHVVPPVTETSVQDSSAPTTKGAVLPVADSVESAEPNVATPVTELLNNGEKSRNGPAEAGDGLEASGQSGMEEAVVDDQPANVEGVTAVKQGDAVDMFAD